MPGASAPTKKQLIRAGVGSALLCLPIYALLTVLAFAATSLGSSGANRPSVLEVLGAMVMAIPFSLLAIIALPISILVAATLFALGGWFLVPRFEKHRSHILIWIASGSVVGLLTGLAMSLEMQWRSSFPFDQGPNSGTIPFAIPTGVFGMWVYGRLLRRSINRAERYPASPFD